MKRKELVEAQEHLIDRTTGTHGRCVDFFGVQVQQAGAPARLFTAHNLT
jgi:hypothetical protein